MIALRFFSHRQLLPTRRLFALAAGLAGCGSSSVALNGIDEGAGSFSATHDLFSTRPASKESDDINLYPLDNALFQRDLPECSMSDTPQYTGLASVVDDGCDATLIYAAANSTHSEFAVLSR